MKTTLKSFAFGSAVLGGALALSACGDDVTKVYRTAEENSGMEIAKSAEDFDDCDSATIGKMMFASDENAAYICADSGWTPLSETVDGKDGVSCFAELLSDSTGYKIMCGEDSVGIILNGKAGAKGAKGEDGEAGAVGENGTSCTVEMLADSSGYKVVCGEDSVGVILNGLDGNGCSLKDNGDGTLSQVCGETTITLYKALCGNNPYDPAKSFCYADSVYALCGGKTFDPSKVFCDDRDSSVYDYVQIGDQTWMAENLNYDYNEGTANSYCYDDDTANCTTYGRLYTWAAAMDACPEGWHLPDTTEWNTLESYVAKTISGGEDSVGYALKSKSGWTEYNDKTGGSDAFGFGALPAGYRYGEGTFGYVQRNADFWSSTEDSASDAYLLDLAYNYMDLFMDYSSKDEALSVRCVKD